MFQSPDHYHNLSLRLSEVMDDIGVNERIVLRTRRSWLLKESVMNINFRINDKHYELFHFGSQSEGSTTTDLDSDVDTLICNQTKQVIQDWIEWKPGKEQYLMVQDETTSPGHCLLQAVQPDIPVPVQHIQQNEHHRIDNRGRILLRHSACFPSGGALDGAIRHGPAQVLYKGPYISNDVDTVVALSCPSWPKEAETWLNQQTVSGWPTADMKGYASEHGCFLVPVASRASVNHDTEWRISTSLAERCLMFSLNMTQIRCYILMKMIMKTYIKPKCEDAISSFMCKNVLFHCIADSRSMQWNDSHLLRCLNQCLQYLFHCILSENCPHFIIPRNNLLAGKLSFQTKQQLVEIMITLTTNIEQSLLAISLDGLGTRLRVKSEGLYGVFLKSSESIASYVLAKKACLTAKGVHEALFLTLKLSCQNNVFITYQKFTQIAYKLSQIHSVGDRLEQAACELIAPFFCASIGSIIASVDIYHSQALSAEALMWFSIGLNSDFSSSWLKLASALYCAGHYEQCEAILLNLTRQLEITTVYSMCSCFDQIRTHLPEYGRICQEKNEGAVIRQNTAFCVRFLPCEVNCLPEELRYEMFRSSEEDLPYRGVLDFWMDWAVIDSKPYTYFLQYKVYSQLHRPLQQQQALHNFAWTINNEPNLGHKETALNLLGQCMERENKKDNAFQCYIMSLNVRPRNNAAKWHICRLLASQLNQ